MITSLYAIFNRFPRIVTDTRKPVEDSLFFALKGPNFNANLFAEKALENGSRYAVVDDPEVVKDERYLLVEDGLTALQELAAYHRSQLSIPVLALTGSNGKTTTKELIRSVLSSRFHTLATAGNLNNHIGVPLTLLSITKAHEFAIIEMGANHRGEIAALCEIARPEFGLITNIGKAHIEGFGSEEGIRLGKGELYDYLRNHYGKVFVNGDHSMLIEMSEGMDRYVYGNYGEQAGIFLRGQFVSADPFLKTELWLDGQKKLVNTQIIGQYNTENVLAAAAVGKYFGVPAEGICLGLENYQPDNNRSQVVQKGDYTLIMDAYNANPSSMKAALENFAGMKAAHKWFILGDMLELGAESLTEHQAIVDLTQELKLEGIFVGPIFGECLTDSKLNHFAHTAEAKDWLRTHKPASGLVLLKGSRGIKLETLAEVL